MFRAMRTTCDVRRKAAAILKARGWTRGQLEKDGRVCLIGAINQTIAGHQYAYPVTPHLRALRERTVQELEAKIRCGLLKWNDTIARSRAQVIKLLLEECP
jgi:hypothetical protein